jgi:hypothetical protein
MKTLVIILTLCAVSLSFTGFNLLNQKGDLTKQIIQKDLILAQNNVALAHKDSLLALLSFDCDSNPVDAEQLLKMQILQKFTEEQSRIFNERIDALDKQERDASSARYRVANDEDTKLFVKYQKLETAEVEKLEKKDAESFEKLKTAVLWDQYPYHSDGSGYSSMYDLEHKNKLSESLKTFFETVNTIDVQEKTERDACKAKHAAIDEKEKALYEGMVEEFNEEHNQILEQKKRELGLQ